MGRNCYGPKCPVTPRQLRAENLTLHYRLLAEAQGEASPQSSVVSQSESENSSCLDCTSDGSKSYQLHETETVASPQFSVVSQSESENSACLDRTSDVSQSSRYLTIEREVVNTLFTAQVQLDLNKLLQRLPLSIIIFQWINVTIRKLCVYTV